MSTLKVSNITDGTTTVDTNYVVNGSAKAWGTVNQTGTQALRDSLNVASITDFGTGDTQYNFSSSMNNTDFACSIVGGADVVATASFTAQTILRSTSYIQCRSLTSTATAGDNGTQQMTLQGDLA